MNLAQFVALETQSKLSFKNESFPVCEFNKELHKITPKCVTEPPFSTDFIKPFRTLGSVLFDKLSKLNNFFF